MAGIGSVTVDLKANTGSFETDFARAAKAAQKHSREVSVSAIAIGTEIGHFLSEAAEGIAHFIEHAVESTVPLAHLAEKTGLSAKALGGLRLAATQSGVDMERLGNTITKVAGIQFEAAAGSKKAAAEMKFFGITAKDTADSAVDKLLKQFNAMPPSFDRAGLAVKIFGQRLGTDFLLVADKAKGGLSDLEKQAEDLGVSLDQDTLEAAEHFEKSMGIVKLQAQSVGEKIIQGVLPTIDALIKKLADPAISAEFKDIAASGVAAFVQIIEWAGKAIAAISGFSKNLASSFAGAAGDDMPRLQQEDKRLRSRLSAIAPEKVDGLGNLWSSMRNRNLTDPYVQGQTGSYSTSFENERSIITKRLAMNAHMRADYAQLEKSAAAAKQAADASAAAEAKSGAVTAAKTQAEYKQLLAALGEKKGGGAHKAKHPRGESQSSIDGASDRFDDWAGRLQGELEGPLARAEAEHIKRMREITDLAEKGKVSHDKLTHVLDLEGQSYKKATGEISARYAVEVAALQGPVARAQAEHIDALRRIDILAKEAGMSSAQLAAAKKEEAKAFERATLAAKREADPLGALLDDMRFEERLLKMTNAERATAIALKGQDTAAIQKYGAAILAENKVLEQQQKSIQLMDTFRSGLADLGLTAIHNFGDVGKSFKKMMDDIAQQIERRILENWISKLFGQQGSTGQGTQGGGAVGGWLDKLFSSSGSSAGGGSSGGGFGGWLSALFGGGHERGGPVSPGKFYEVGEGNKPEMLNMGGRSYLLPGNSGQVTPMQGSGLTQINHFNYAAPYDARTESQKNGRLAFETRRAMERNR